MITTPGELPDRRHCLAVGLALCIGLSAEEEVMSVGRILCRFGVHRWAKVRNPEGGEFYLQCQRCGREKDTVTIGGFNPG